MVAELAAAGAKLSTKGLEDAGIKQNFNLRNGGNDDDDVKKPASFNCLMTAAIFGRQDGLKILETIVPLATQKEKNETFGSSNSSLINKLQAYSDQYSDHGYQSIVEFLLVNGFSFFDECLNSMVGVSEKSHKHIPNREAMRFPSTFRNNEQGKAEKERIAYLLKPFGVQGAEFINGKYFDSEEMLDLTFPWFPIFHFSSKYFGDSADVDAGGRGVRQDNNNELFLQLGRKSPIFASIFILNKELFLFLLEKQGPAMLSRTVSATSMPDGKVIEVSPEQMLKSVDEKSKCYPLAQEWLAAAAKVVESSKKAQSE